MSISELGLNYDEFVGIIEDLKPSLSELLISHYQPYISAKLGKEISQNKVKSILTKFFEDYRYSDIFDTV